MRLEPLYVLRWRYPEHWRAGDAGLYLADGACAGRIEGRFRGANRATRRADGSFLPDLAGAIETPDGASILLRLGGYGWPHDGRAAGWITHVAEGDRYGWLNDVVAVFAGEVADRDIRLEVAELVWEAPLPWPA